MTPIVSVLIPAHNAGCYIEETIVSALNQSCGNLEVIVVDDGSSDNTLEVAKAFESKGVKLIHQSNRGASAARNRALNEAVGQWIQFLDADDILHPEKIQRQLRVAEVYGEDYLYCAEWSRFVNSPNEAIFRQSDFPKDSDPVTWLIDKYSGRGVMPHHACLAHRSLVEKAGYWNELLSLNDDGEYFDRLVLKSKGIIHTPGAKAYYRSNVQNSMSARVDRAAAKSALQALRLCSDRLLAIQNDVVTQQAFALQYMLYACQFYPTERDLAAEAVTQANALGGADFQIPGGNNLRSLSKVIGWKAARLLQYYYYSWRQRRP